MTIASAPQLRATWECLEAALRRHRPVHVIYHDRYRLVSPHALGWKGHRPMLLAYQADNLTAIASADPHKRWRCMFIDEIERVVDAEPAATWQTADNYNPSRPFNAIDHVAVAVDHDQLPPEPSAPNNTQPVSAPLPPPTAATTNRKSPPR